MAQPAFPSGKLSHRCILLRESYRENGQVRNRTLANLTHCAPQEVAALRLALKHKGDLTELTTLPERVTLQQGPSVGAAWLVYAVARRLGIEKALGTTRAGKLALWQVMARVMAQGSRLSAVRLAQAYAACDILVLKDGFTEEHLDKNLAWLAKKQQQIEKRLFTARRQGKQSALFFYDVTSSYMEGVHNALADWEDNRDKKGGKKQVVVGLLCDEDGDPGSMAVFTGNQRDFHTFAHQIHRATKVFRCSRGIFVGDRGMINSPQIAQVTAAAFSYITAITKPQIAKFLRAGVFQLAWFTSEIWEVEHDTVRYILRRNPQRVEELTRTRQEKKETIAHCCQKKTGYLAGHPRAKVSTALKELKERMVRLKVAGWLKGEAQGR